MPDHGSPDALAGLDADQRRAVEAVTGPLLVVAGPGSGKTRTLTHRLAHLVTRHAVPPSRCLAVTFTRRAAGEMRDRLRTLLPDAWERVPLHTFHSLGLSILREHWNAAGLQRGFRIASEAERIQLLRDALRVSERKARGRLSAISHAKRTGTRPPDGESGEAFEAYERAMETRNLCDFDDLVIRAADALESTPGLQADYRRRHAWVCIDEYQDVDEQQVRLVRQLVPPDGNVCAIGDPDQAIYGFRGADVRFFSEFQQDFPGTRVVRLTRNYRSERNIVALSGQVIGPSGCARRSALAAEAVEARDAEAMQAREAGDTAEDVSGLVTLHEAPTDKAEAEFIVQSLERILGGHSFFSIDSGRSPDGEGHDLSFSDFAVLYRTEAQAVVLAEALQRSGLPFQQRSHRRLMEHPGVTALLDALREGPGAGPVRERLEAACSALERSAGETPGAGSDRERLDAVRTAVVRPAAEGPGTSRPDEPRGRRVERPAAEMPVASVLPEARELLRPAAVACGDDLERFLSDLSLGTEVDTWDPRADRISLLTLHAAKGLEFPVVFIAGCENGLLPLAWGRPDRTVLDEERRLFYVGVTRAKTKLFLCRAKKRLWRGKVRELPPSPYLADVEERLLERRRSRIPGKQAKDGDSQPDLFSRSGATGAGNP